MLYVFCGLDSFSMQEAVDEVKKALGDGDLASLNTASLDGTRISAEQLLGACNSFPFFADRRLIVIGGLLGRFESSEARSQERSAGNKGTAKVEPWQIFADCLGSLPETVDVVLKDDRVSPSNPLMKALAKKSTVKWFAPLRPGELPAWIEKRTRASGGSMSPNAVRLLTEAVGNNLWVLAAEIEKLLVYRNPGKVTEDDVRMLVSYVRDASVFAMVDAIVERRTQLALRLMHQLVEHGATSPYLLAMITRQFRLLIQAKELAAHRARPQEIRRVLGISSDFVFDKVTKQTSGYSLEQLEEVYTLLLQVDIDGKTGRVDQGVALDLLVTDLCLRPPRDSSRATRSA